MKISKIQLLNYKSLENVQIRPSQMTVLVGPNNSGKSNIVDALGFLATVYATSPKAAVDSRGGFENIAFRTRGSVAKEISFRVELTADRAEVAFYTEAPREEDDLSAPPTDRIRFRHEFTLKGLGASPISDFVVSREMIQIDSLDPRMKTLLKVVRNEKKSSYSVIETESDRAEGIVLPTFTENRDLADNLITKLVPRRVLIADRLRMLVPTLMPFLDHLERMRVYQLAPNECRSPAVPNSIANLGVSGDNLPALVYYLQEHHPPIWNRVLQNMAEIVTGLSNIEIKGSYDRLWNLHFKQTAVVEGSEQADEWTAHEVSDGTIRTLGLIASVYDPRSSLLAVEEPENSVHPWILRRFSQVCREVLGMNEDRQILVTTHSPILINYSDPKDVLVVWKQDGRTQVSPLLKMDDDIRGMLDAGDLLLFDVLDSGYLPAAVPNATT